MPGMANGHGQFCPIAKASEVFATRWTPLILRELMTDSHSFNDIHRGVPLISRAVLVTRLRELEDHGVVERRARPEGSGHEYWLTPAGEALRPIVDALGRWGLAHARDWIEPADFDPTVLMWTLRSRADAMALPKSSHGGALRILGRAEKPHEVSYPVAYSRTRECGRMRQRPRFRCRPRMPR